MRRTPAPRFDLPAEVSLGRLKVPAIYFRIAGVAATLGLFWLVGQLLG